MNDEVNEIVEEMVDFNAPTVPLFQCNTGLGNCEETGVQKRIQGAKLVKGDDPHYACIKCGNRLEYVGEAPAEFYSVAVYFLGRRIDATVRAYEYGNWPIAKEYVAYLLGRRALSDVILFTDQLPDESLEGIEWSSKAT